MMQHAQNLEFEEAAQIRDHCIGCVSCSLRLRDRITKKTVTKAKLPDVLRLSGLHDLCNH